MADGYGTEGPLIIYKRVERLKDLAMLSPALQLVRFRLENICEIRVHRALTYALLLSESRQLVANYDMKILRDKPIPIAIWNLLTSRADDLHDAWLRWWDNHYCSGIFCQELEGFSERLGLFDEVAWCTDGTIDYVRTAIKMIHGNEMNMFEKFRLASLYCLEDELTVIWRASTECERSLMISYKKAGHLLFTYWVNIVIGCTAIYSRNLQRAIVLGAVTNNVTAMEYFWDLVEPEERSMVLTTIAKHKEKLLLLRLMMKLSPEMFTELMRECGDHVMARLITEPKYFEITMQIWYRIRNVLNSAKFIDMLHKMAEFFHYFESDVDDLRSYIWQAAPEHLKRCLERNSVQISSIECVYPNYKRVKGLNRDFRYLLAVLPYFSSDSRRSFWMAHWPQLIIGASPRNMEQLIELCMQNEEDALDFMQNRMAEFRCVQKYCAELINWGYIAELKEFLTFCSLYDSAEFVKLTKQLYASLHVSNVYSACTRNAIFFEEFDAFMKDAFDDEQQPKVRKIDLVLSSENYVFICKHRAPYKYPRTIDVLDHFVTDEGELAKMKSWYRENLVRLMMERMSNEFDWQNFPKFLSWCFDDNQKEIAKLKEALPLQQMLSNELDFVFQTNWKKLNLIDMSYPVTHKLKKYMMLFSTMLQCIDGFLLWYFHSEQVARECKLRVVKEYESIATLKLVLQSEKPRLVDAVLLWFFNDDYDQMEEFKESNLPRRSR